MTETAINGVATFTGFIPEETHAQMMERMLGETNMPRVKWLVPEGAFESTDEFSWNTLMRFPVSALRYRGVEYPIRVFPESAIYDISDMD